MKGAFQIAKFAGIPIVMHWSFILIVAYVAYIGFIEGESFLETLFLLGAVLLIFTCVVLHEYGHALTARRFNVKTIDIILTPIGGIARLEHLPEKPMEEFYVAIAGPLVNVVIIAILSIYFLFFPETIDFIAAVLWDKPMGDYPAIMYVVPLLILANAVMVVFNMIPAFPMDGGRVLRSLLSLKVGRLKATQIASYLGRFLAICIFFYAIWTGRYITSLIGVFVYFTASHEYKLVKQESLLNNHLAKELMNSNFSRFKESDTIQTIVSNKKEWEKNFLVFDENNHITGVIHEAFFNEAIKNKDQSAYINQYKSPKYEGLSVDNNLRYVYSKMHAFGYSILPVYENGSLVGVIDMNMMNDYLGMKTRPKKEG